MTATRASWLEAAIQAFNYPYEMGERLEDALAELSALAEAPPAEATPADREMVAALREESARAVDAAHGDGAGSAYSAARLADGGLELFDGARDAWVPYRERRSAQRREGPDEVVEPRHAWTLPVRRQLDDGDLPGARRAIAEALLRVTTYDPTALALMFRWYERSGADEEQLGVVYHGASAWSLALKQQTFLGWRRLPKPPRLKSRFGALYAEWVREAWPGVDALTPDELFHLRRLFEALAARPLADLRKQIDARIAAILAQPR